MASRRGSKGGFHLASGADRITMGEVIDFFLAKHPIEPEGNSPVMRVLQASIEPCQRAFGELSLAEVAQPREMKNRRSVTNGSARPVRKHRVSPKEVVR